MSKIRTRIRTTVIAAAVVVLTATGISIGTAGTANASVCGDGVRLVIHYVEVGDQATASALMDTLVSMGC